MSLLSKKRVKVSASAKKHATIKSIAVSVGTFNKTVNTSTADVLFDGLTNASGEITYMITATDSRNNVTTWTHKAKYHQYVRPSIINLNVARNGAESSNGAISADGEYWNGKVGNTTNAINITISGSATGNTTGLLNGNKWSATKPIGGANPNQAYTYTLTVTDSFGQSISRDITLAIEKALMQLGKTQVDVNGNFAAEDYYYKKGDNYQKLSNMFYPMGDDTFIVKDFSVELAPLAGQQARYVNVPYTIPKGYKLLCFFEAHTVTWCLTTIKGVTADVVQMHIYNWSAPSDITPTSKVIVSGLFIKTA